MNGSTQQERRTCQRLALNKTLQVEFASGERISGESLDISLGGVLLKVKQLPEGVRENQSARLYIILHDGEISTGYPCTIIRKTHNCLGLQLDMQHAAGFGKELTHGIFSRKPQELE